MACNHFLFVSLLLTNQVNHSSKGKFFRAYDWICWVLTNAYNLFEVKQTKSM